MAATCTFDVFSNLDSFGSRAEAIGASPRAVGSLDDLEVHVVPVLLGQGRRPFDNLAREHFELQRISALPGEDGVTRLRYRIPR
jgi:hypothetical protein